VAVTTRVATEKISVLRLHVWQEFVNLLLMARFGFGSSRLFARWRRVGRFTDLVVALGLILALATVAAVFELKRRGNPDVIGFGVAIDGDSMRLAGDEIRLEGIDAPEYGQSCRDAAGRDYACGRLARQALSRLLSRGEIKCLVSGRDRYDRKLARCYLDEQDINATLVRTGQAIAYGRYESEEAVARSGKTGVWAGSFERPADYRRSHPRNTNQ
jgi:Staphylococcal nuclease homologue